VSSTGFAQAPTFDTLTSTYKGRESWHRIGVAAVGDFNGDGQADAFVADGSPGHLKLFLGNGNGSFSVRNISTFSPGSNSAVTIVRAADFNGDGLLDAVGSSGQGDLKPLVMLNTGNDVSGVPQFTVTSYAAFGSGIRSSTVGDLNGDGSPDFIVGNAYASLQVYLNDGTGVFTAGQSTSITGGGGPSVGTGVIADLNGDGNTDFVVSSSQSTTTNVFFGNGDGTLQAPVEITSNSFKATVADVNNDGNPDLLEVDGANLKVFLNAGGGTFGLPTLYTTGGNYPSSLAIADINGDGNLDAVIANQNSNNAAVLLGDGSGAFGAATVFTVNQVPIDLTVGDFNSDGKLDIATSGYNDGTYAVLLNTTPVPLPTQTLTILGGSGNPGETTTNVEYYNPVTEEWQPAYMADYGPYGHPGGHPWGKIAGTSGWVNHRADGASVGAYLIWYDYRIRFTAPASYSNPTMVFSLKADNYAQVAINGTNVGGLITGSTDQNNADAVFSQSLVSGENEITIRVGDSGGLNGFNFRIDLTVDSEEPLEELEVEPSDTVAPVITAADVSAEATGPLGAAVSFTATAVDDVDGSVTVGADPASGSTFALGQTTVNLGAYDAAGNFGEASLTVTVVDTTPPVITAPADITAEATSASGAAVNFTATALDIVDGSVSVVADPASGSAFALGSHTVDLGASDNAGNDAYSTFAVTVQDTTAPVITGVTPSITSIWPPNKKMVPVSVTVDVTDAVGVVSSRIVSVSSNQADRRTQWDVTGPLTVNLLANRNGKEGARIYTITVEVTDAAGNTSTATTVVTVPHDQGKSVKSQKSDKSNESGKSEKSDKSKKS